MGTKTYVCNNGRLGPVTVQVNGKDVRVYSALGSKSYSFEKLPINYDNRCSILKYSVKHYFDEILDACPAIKSKKEQQSVLRMINFFFPLPRLSNSPGVHEELCFEVYNNSKKYDWEEIDGFIEYNGTEDAAEALKLPPVVAFVGFEQKYFYGSSSLQAIERLEVEQKNSRSINEIKKVVEGFVSGEVLFYLKMVEYSKSFAVSQISERLVHFYEILESHKLMIESYISRFGPHFIDVLTIEMREGLASSGIVIELKNNESLRHNLNIATISEVLLEQYDLFTPYKSFMGTYEHIMEVEKSSVEIRECFAAIIQRITGYLQIAKSFLMYDSSHTLKMLYSKFFNLNVYLNDTAEKAYLDNEEKKLMKMCKGVLDNVVVHGHKLLGCILNLTAKKGTVHIIGVDLVDIYFFDKKMFVFIENDALESNLFQNIANSKLSFGVFQYNNRETAVEFRNIFYSVKYNAKKQGNVYRSNEVNAYTSIIVSNVQDEALPTNLEEPFSSEPRYTVKIEYKDLQISPVSRYTEAEIFSRISCLQSARNAALESTESFLLKHRALMNNISKARLDNFAVIFYNEDSVSYSSKLEIFQKLLAALRRNNSDKSTEFKAKDEKQSATENNRLINSPETEDEKLFHAILYDNDVLKVYCPGYISNYLSQYFLVLHSCKRASKVIAEQPSSYLAVVFAIFVQRNIYALASPTELVAISACIEEKRFDEIISSVSSRNRSNIEGVITAARTIYGDCPVLARLIVRMLASSTTPDEVIEKVLLYKQSTVLS